MDDAPRRCVLVGGLAVLVAALTFVKRAQDAPPARRRKDPLLVELHALREKGEVPLRLRPAFYFDFEAHPFAHSQFLTSARDVVDVVGSIHSYVVSWLERHSSALGGAQFATAPASTKVVGALPPIYLAESGFTDLVVGAGSSSGSVENTLFSPDTIIGASDAKHVLHVCLGAQVLGGTFDLRAGGIWLGESAVIEPGAHVAGPAIIGRNTVVRCGAYLRGDLVIGDAVVLRGELKNAVVMDRAELAHPGYCGDSLIGHRGHFGCQALTANLGLFGSELSVELPAEQGVGPKAAVRCRLGRRKLGLVLGDGSQLGCNSVTDPATFIAPRTHVYPLSRIAAGTYGPDEIIKNRVAEGGILTRSPMRQ